MVKPGGTTSGYIFLEVHCHPKVVGNEHFEVLTAPIPVLQMRQPSWYKGMSGQRVSLRWRVYQKDAGTFRLARCSVLGARCSVRESTEARYAAISASKTFNVNEGRNPPSTPRNGSQAVGSRLFSRAYTDGSEVP